jgi:hypothetical protein
MTISWCGWRWWSGDRAVVGPLPMDPWTNARASGNNNWPVKLRNGATLEEADFTSG